MATPWKTLKGYEMVIGLEVHVELKTKTKIFCCCTTDFGARAQHPVLPGVHGHARHAAGAEQAGGGLRGARPGWPRTAPLPAIPSRTGRTTSTPTCPRRIRSPNTTCPCAWTATWMMETPEGEKRIGITRIHIEEDAGKLIHDPRAGHSHRLQPLRRAPH